MKKVSMIVPIYNVERYFERFLVSAFEQTYPDIEYIFVDDNSPDGSIDVLNRVLERYPDRKKDVRIIHHNKNLGLTQSRNDGLACATGDYIYQCDSDDWLDHDLVRSLVEKAESENADIVVCDSTFIYEDRTEPYTSSEWTNDKVKSLNDYINSEWTTVWCMLVKKSVYDQNKIKSPEDIRFCEDFHLTVRLLYSADKVVNLHKSLYFYNRANVSSMTQDFSDVRMTSEYKTYYDIIDFFKAHNDYRAYERSMNWRLLKGKIDLLFDKDKHDKYLQISPESHRHILSVPYYYPRLRILAWCLTHNLGGIARYMLRLWEKRNR